ncbi:hypothetical protein [Rhodococcoides yunnanense]|uniref:hypothetical protein n=1 Tax=Rhodococcoides yunnanense TaxID=278209 RepID=UPI000934D996|nr:hypothetical protein [Rhodococcus yunnanensis]
MKYRSLLWWITGRRAPVADDSVAFTAERGTLGTPIAFGVAGVIEMVAAHLLVPWPWLQWTLLIASLWGLISFAGFLALHRVHPHVLSPDALTLRSNGKIVAEIPREMIVAARVHRRFGVVSAAIEDGRLFLPTQDGTGVDIELSTPVVAELPATLVTRRVQEAVSSLGIQVDDPAALVRALTPAQTPGPAASP